MNRIKEWFLHLTSYSFGCKIGFHKLRYVTQYLNTSKLKCSRLNCNAVFIEGQTGELYTYQNCN